MVVYYLFSCTCAHHSTVHSIDHHIYRSIHPGYWNNTVNKRTEFRYIHSHRCKPFHLASIYNLDYSRNSSWLMCLRIYDHIGEFLLWHTHQRCNEVVRHYHRYSQTLCCILNDNQCIGRLCTWIGLQNMYRYLFYSWFRHWNHRNRLRHRNDIVDGYI